MRSGPLRGRAGRPLRCGWGGALRRVGAGLAVAVCLSGFGALTGLAPVVTQANAQVDERISEIKVEGNERIEAATVISYMAIAVGDPYDADRIDRSLKTLFSTGLFADVVIDRVGSALVVKVVENPIINRLAFEGNDKLDDDALQTEVQLRPRQVYTRARVQSDLQRILQLYRRNGRFAATVEPKIIQLEQNRVDLVFEINEGPVTSINRIIFVGNKKFSDARLEEAISTKESRWYRFLASNDIYDPDRLTYDRELLRKFYLAQGYADFRVASAVAELTPKRDSFFITFTLEEGEQYKFGKVDLQSNIKNVDVEKLKEMIITKSGETYNADLVEANIQVLAFELGKQGYAFVDIAPQTVRNATDRVLDLTYVVGEGERMYVERVNITGNTRTLDRVIRREMRLEEGDPFNTAKLRRSKTRIRGLDFFEVVEIKESRGSAPDRLVLDVEVAEKGTGEINFGLGYSTTDAALVDLSIRERNLLGRGQDIKAAITYSARRQQGDISFTEPYFLDREIAAGFDLFSTRNDQQRRSGYIGLSTGGSVRAGYAVTEYLGHSVRYTLRRDSIEEVIGSSSTLLLSQVEPSIVSAIGQSFIYDLRNDRIEPSSGYVLRLSQEFAGVGGSERYLRHTGGGNYYYPVFDQVVFNAGVNAGHVFGIGQDIRLTQRFFLGGDNLRGFETRGVGPREPLVGQSLGGNVFYSGTVGLTFPVGIPKEFGVTGRAFTDFGALWDPDIDPSRINDSASPRASVGFGVSWRSPFGPIGFDLAYPLLKEDFDKTEIFRLNFGTRY